MLDIAVERGQLAGNPFIAGASSSRITPASRTYPTRPSSRKSSPKLNGVAADYPATRRTFAGSLPTPVAG